jgi:hypothetical protein
MLIDQVNFHFGAVLGGVNYGWQGLIVLLIVGVGVRSFDAGVSHENFKLGARRKILTIDCVFSDSIYKNSDFKNFAVLVV